MSDTWHHQQRRAREVFERLKPTAAQEDAIRRGWRALCDAYRAAANNGTPTGSPAGRGENHHQEETQ